MATPTRPSQRVRFAEFELDLSTRELWADGRKETLAPQPFQLLRLLIENRGQLVTREQLVSCLWPSDTFVDYEQGLKKAVNRLREVLNDSAEQPRFIETLPRQGYRFIAELEFETARQTPASKPIVLHPHLVGSEPVTKATRRMPFRVLSLLAAFLVVVVCVGGILYWRNRVLRRKVSAFEPKLTQLTANSFENPVISSAISPDGKYLAFTDQANKIRLRLIATGETQTIAQPELAPGSVEWVIAAWFPDSTRFIVNARPPSSYYPFPSRLQHPTSSQPRDANSSTWIVSVLGKTAQKLRDNADGFSVSPDGSLIAFGTNTAELGDREIWLMDSKGLQGRKLWEAPANRAIGGLKWSGDGQRVVYFQVSASDGELVSRDLRGGPPIPLVQYSGAWSVNDFALLEDDRVIYARDGNFWELSRDALSGKSPAVPRQLTNWSGRWVGEMSATEDGKHLAFQRWTSQSTISIADIEAHGTRLSPPRHFTASEYVNAAETWTPDSTALIFRSKRNERQRLFKQALESDTEQPLVMGAEEVGGAAVSPDGSWLFYLDCGPHMTPGCDQIAPLIRIPIGGGEPRQVLTSNTYGRPRCAVAPANLCVIAEESDDKKHLVFTSFDAFGGRGAEVARFETEEGFQEYGWAVSPDAFAIAVLGGGDNRVHILSLRGKPPKVVTASNWTNLATVYWRPDGQGWFTMTKEKSGVTLLYVDLKGEAHPLLRLDGHSAAYGIPSPDGRHLAIVAVSRNNNVWLTQNF
jgi:DNA-binding winged helix-turn-helix (wHTH) protein/Tol biopolymer transport system component